MPELPEVESAARMLKPQLVGKRIVGIKVNWPHHIDRPDTEEFRFRISGLRFLDVTRRAKFLVFSLENEETLLIHLRMSGHLSVVPASPPYDKHTHTIFELDSGEELRFRDTRKFGRVYLVNDPQDVLGKLGPEPLDPSFTVEILKERLENRKRILKPMLLDQGFIAGIGNIYADEALFDARLLPTRRTDTLTDSEIEALHHGIQEVLKLGIEKTGASFTTFFNPDGSQGEMQNSFNVFQRTGENCYRCGGVIERIKLGGRSTHFCPQCQK